MKITNKEIIRHNISRLFLLGAMFATPAAALAQSTFGTGGSSSSCSTQQSLCSLVSLAIGYFNQAIYLIIALAVLTFVWNIYRYFIVKDPENKSEASKYVMFSVIGLFVILSFWGLVNIVSNTLNLNTAAGSINVQALTGNSSGVGSSAFTSNGSSAGGYGGYSGSGSGYNGIPSGSTLSNPNENEGYNGNYVDDGSDYNGDGSDNGDYNDNCPADDAYDSSTGDCIPVDSNDVSPDGSGCDNGYNDAAGECNSDNSSDVNSNYNDNGSDYNADDYNDGQYTNTDDTNSNSDQNTESSVQDPNDADSNGNN